MSFNSSVIVSSSIDMNKEGNNNYNLYIVDATSSKEDINITLPSTVSDGLTYDFIRTDTNEAIRVILTTSDREITINNSDSLVFNINTRVQLVFSIRNWIAPIVTVSYR